MRRVKWCCDMVKREVSPGVPDSYLTVEVPADDVAVTTDQVTAV